MVCSDGHIYYHGKNVAEHDNGRGYLYVTIKYKKIYVHRVVLEAYKGPPPSSGMDVNHINGKRFDNRPENLEWCTRSENVQHAYTVLKRKPSCNQLGKSGNLHHASIGVLSIKDTAIIEHGSIRECAKYFGISKGTVANYAKMGIPYLNGVSFQYNM